MGILQLHRRRLNGGSVVVPDKDALFSLRKKWGWSKAFIKIERLSDNQQAFIFFDGAIAYDSINLNSYISTTSDTTPSTTTLGNWVGANSAEVVRWIGMNPDNVINPKVYSQCLTTPQRPKIIDSGNFILLNGKPSIHFTNDIMSSDIVDNKINALDSGKSFTLLTVSNNDIDNGNGGVFNSTFNKAQRLTLFHERSATKRIFQISTNVATYATNYITQQNNANQKLLSCTVDSNKLLTAYFNGVEQEAIQMSGDYINDSIRIGSNLGNQTYLKGKIQEIWAVAANSDPTAYHADVNNYYSIY